MKGIVFTEFLEMVEAEFGMDIVDDVLMNSELKSGGVYTAVGTYDHHEILELVAQLSQRVKTPVPDLVKAFGSYLFKRFVEIYPGILNRMTNSVELFSNVEGYIHVEVKKLYPDAELPTLEFREKGEKTWELVYKSARPFADLAHGLVEACVAHYGVGAEIEREDLQVETGVETRFTLVYEKSITTANA